MGGKDEDIGAADHVFEAVSRAFHEIGVAGEEPFVHQQDLRADGGGEREAETDDHASAIDADGQVDEFVHFGELADVGFELGDGAWVKPGVEAAERDVFPAGEAEVHAQGGVEQGVEGAVDADPAVEGFVDAGQGAQQGGFPRAVAADEAEAVAGFEAEGNVAQGLDDNAMAVVLAHALGDGAEQGFLQTAAAGVIEREVEADVMGLDRGRDEGYHVAHTQKAMRPRTRVKTSQAMAHSTIELVRAEI